MPKYAIHLLAVVLVGCSEKQTETTQVASSPAAATEAPAADSMARTGSLTPQAVLLADIPASLRLPGQLQEGWRWQDANGENLLVVFRTVGRSKQPQAAPPPASSEVEDMHDLERSAQLRVRQYVRQRGEYTELWRLQDAVTSCALDMTLELQPGSTAITDLDHDGRSETTLMYALACRGDVSGADLKLIMRAGSAKYALRGSTVVQYDSVPARQRQPRNPCCLNQFSAAQREQDNTEGYYQTEAEFQTAPPAFLAFARQHWQKFSVEELNQSDDL